MEPLTINLDSVASIAKTGINRAMLFMGFGINAAKDSEFKRFQLTDHTPYILIPGGVTNEVLNAWKEEFGLWTTTNGLREIMEFFDVFLDNLNHICLFTLLMKGKIDQPMAAERDAEFKKRGKKEKFNKLNSWFGIDFENKDMLLTINQARHCFSHRAGVVGRDDMRNGADKLTICWTALELFMEMPNGEKKPIPLPLKEPVFNSPVSPLKMSYTNRTKSFAVGHRITLEPNDLAEIGLFVSNSVDQICRSTVEFAKNAGVVIVDKSKTG